MPLHQSNTNTAHTENENNKNNNNNNNNNTQSQNMGLFSSTDDKGEKKSLYQKFQDKKRGPPISDADLLKYTGKSREEFDSWRETQPGVGKNQLCGTLAVGGASGLGGVAAAGGVGGWGPGAAPSGPNRGMKFPPEQKSEKEKALEEDDD